MMLKILRVKSIQKHDQYFWSSVERNNFWIRCFKGTSFTIEVVFLFSRLIIWKAFTYQVYQNWVLAISVLRKWHFLNHEVLKPCLCKPTIYAAHVNDQLVLKNIIHCWIILFLRLLPLKLALKEVILWNPPLFVNHHVFFDHFQSFLPYCLLIGKIDFFVKPPKKELENLVRVFLDKVSHFWLKILGDTQNLSDIRERVHFGHWKKLKKFCELFCQFAFEFAFRI